MTRPLLALAVAFALGLAVGLSARAGEPSRPQPITLTPLDAAPRPAVRLTDPPVPQAEVWQRTGAPFRAETPAGGTAPHTSSGTPSRAAVPPVAPSPTATPPEAAGSSGRQSAATPPAATPRPPRTARTALSGTASWGWGWSGVVTRLPRGTRIRVCGPLACWSGRSEGHGPAAWTGRIADLSRSVFARLCGDPARGLCRVTLEAAR